MTVTFPTGQDNASKIARIQVSTITLQNLNGPGQSCPASIIPTKNSGIWLPVLNWPWLFTSDPCVFEGWFFASCRCDCRKRIRLRPYRARLRSWRLRHRRLQYCVGHPLMPREIVRIRMAKSNAPRKLLEDDGQYSYNPNSSQDLTDQTQATFCLAKHNILHGDLYTYCTYQRWG